MRIRFCAQPEQTLKLANSVLFRGGDNGACRRVFHRAGFACVLTPTKGTPEQTKGRSGDDDQIRVRFRFG